MSEYLERECCAGTSPRHVVRHMLGLYQGMRGARQWRRLLSDADQLDAAGAGILEIALRVVEQPLRAAA
jgi:tRNA-dihydrouridine synthase A